MKYELETIPVWDSLKEDCECPLCLLKERAQKRYIKFYLGSSVMNPETRVEANSVGFCPPHYEHMLKTRGKAMEVGFLMLTYAQQSHREFSKKVKAITKGKKKADSFLDWAENKESSCLICQKIEHSVLRYAFTFIHLFLKDGEFEKAIKSSKGFCLPHFKTLVQMAVSDFSPKKVESFLTSITELQEKNFTRLEEEIDLFAHKFDPQYNDTPWGTSRDAHRRGIKKWSGLISPETEESREDN